MTGILNFILACFCCLSAFHHVLPDFIQGRPGSVCFFVLHNSKHLSKNSFNDVVRATRVMNQVLKTIAHSERLYFGVVTFSDSSIITQDPFDPTKEGFFKHLNGLEREGNGTNVANAISSIRDYITKTRWQRPRDVFPPMMIIFTGDEADDIPAARAESLKAQIEGMILVVVGLDNVNRSAYQDIATGPVYISILASGQSPDSDVQTLIQAITEREGYLFTEVDVYDPTFDVAFVLCNSKTLDSKTFKDMRQITKQLIKSLSPTNCSEESPLSVGLMTYSDRPRLVRRLRVVGSVINVSVEVDRIEQNGQGYDLESGLKLLDGMFGWYTHNHLQGPNLAIVFTADGPDDWNQAVSMADHVKGNGLPLVVIGLGNLSPDILSSIGSNDNVVFQHHDGCNITDTVKNVTDAIRKVAILPGFDSCSELFLDLAFVVDVLPDHLPHVVDALTDRLLTMDLATVRIGLVIYDPDPSIQRTFRAIGNSQKFSNIRRILDGLEVQVNDNVSLSDTMVFLREVVFNSEGNERPEAQNVAMFITDRNMERTEEVEDAVKKTRDAGVHMMVVGVGLKEEDVKWLGSDPRGIVTAPSVLTLKETLKIAHHRLCPAGCSRSSLEFQGMCYEFHTAGSSLSWQNSRKHCVKSGHTLPVITSPNVEDFIRSSFFFWPGSFFLGLEKSAMTDHLPKGQFQWEDGKPLIYKRWAKNSSIIGLDQQPDGGFLELCHVSDVDGWHDIGCAKESASYKTMLCMTDAGDHTTSMQVPRIPKVTITVKSLNTSVIGGLAVSDYQLAYTYTCDNGELTARHFRCNGIPDCSDGSDENDCDDFGMVIGDGCTEDEFPCNNGRCVSYNLYCDFWDDCGDNSDEEGCVRASCESDSTECANGQCVSARAQCDLIVDCADRSDEMNCDTCSSNLETCYDGTCLPKMWLRDKITDCGGVEGEDETTLGGTSSTPIINQLLWWQSSDRRSDVDRCLLVPDEYGRYILFQGVNRTEKPAYSDYKNCANSTCAPGEYKCPDSYCILSSNVCDGKQDCPGGQDEHHCDKLYCPTYFRCRNSTRCLHPAQVCNKRVDCPLADDERLCSDRCGSNPDCREGIVTLTSQMNVKQLQLHTVTKLDMSWSRRSINNLALNNPLYLGHLNMSHTLLKGIGTMLYSLKNLVEVDLSHNSFQAIRTKHFKKNRLLKVLNLSFNTFLKDISPKAFQRNDKLKVLYLNNCNIKHLASHTFHGLSSLTSLDLSFNDINYIEDDAFGNLTSLQRLELRGNPISQFSAGVFNGLDDLEFLTADNYILCCEVVKPASLSPANCHTPRNSLSSCEDLMQNELLRVFIWVLGVMALVGNFVVFLYRVIFDRNSLRRAYGYFLLSLAISDFLMGVYLIIVARADLKFRGTYIWHDSEWRSSGLCKAAGFLSTLSCESSAIFICLITFDRLLVIKYPFRQISFNRTSVCVTNVLAWLVALTLAAIPLLPWSAFWQLYGQNGACLPLPLTSERLLGWQYSTGVFIGFNLITFLLIAVGQYLIYRYMKEGSMVKTKQRRSQELAVARKLSLVVITDFLCWFPVCLMGVLALTGTRISGEVYAWTAVFVLPVNSAINPILYTVPFIIPTIRKLCHGKGGSKTEVQSHASVSNTQRDSDAGTATGLSKL